jgi:hypothetical protein
VEKDEEVSEMEWQFIVAIAILVPIIVFPVAFVWFLNLHGVLALMRKRRAAQKAAKYPRGISFMG